MDQELTTMVDEARVGDKLRKLIPVMGFTKVDDIYLLWPPNPAKFFAELINKEPKRSRAGRLMWGRNTHYDYFEKGDKPPDSFTFSIKDTLSLDLLRESAITKVVR